MKRNSSGVDYTGAMTRYLKKEGERLDKLRVMFKKKMDDAVKDIGKPKYKP